MGAHYPPDGQKSGNPDPDPENPDFPEIFFFLLLWTLLDLRVDFGISKSGSGSEKSGSGSGKSGFSGFFFFLLFLLYLLLWTPLDLRVDSGGSGISKSGSGKSGFFGFFFFASTELFGPQGRPLMVRNHKIRIPPRWSG